MSQIAEESLATLEQAQSLGLLPEEFEKIREEKMKEMEIKTISQQKIIQRGAKFFKKRLAILLQFSGR